MNPGVKNIQFLEKQSAARSFLSIRQYTHIRVILAFHIFFFSSSASAQLSGVKTIPGDYATVSAAVTALNAVGVGADGVIFNISANYIETISTTISLTATGTAANTIIFQKDPATSGANPLITSYSGGVGTPGTAIQDGIWRLIGSDYITIDGIDLQENPANIANPSTMEYGFALYKSSVADGCQNVSIINCVITLNRINNATGTGPMVDGSTGILVVNSTPIAAITALTIATSGGTNSNNNFYNNTIQNCNTGIAIIGYAAASPFSAADQYNDIGGSTAATGNRILNFGGAAGATNAAIGIRTMAQYNFNVAFNTINNNNGSGVNHVNTLKGIWINLAVSASVDVTNNIISLKSAATTQAVSGIENASGSTAVGNEINISNNTVSNCTATNATTGSFYGIYNVATPGVLTIVGNSITNNSTGATGTGVYYPIWNSGAVVNTIDINNNIIGGITFNAATSVAFIGINNTAGNAASSLSISNNEINDITYSALSVAGNTYISNTAATLSQNISSNTFRNLNVNTTGAIIFISNSVVLSSTGNQVVDDNNIVGNFTRSNTAASGALTIFTSTATNGAGSVISNSNNDFSNITVSGAATIAGWVNTDAGASLKTIQGNTFSHWKGGTGTITVINTSQTGTTNAIVNNIINNINGGGIITGINTLAGNDNIYLNNISNLNSTGGTITVVTGISVAGGTSKSVYQNIITNLSANNSTTGQSTTLWSVNGISVSGGATVNIYENKISALTANSISTGTVNGIAMSAGNNVSLYRNKIYSLSSASTVLTTGGVNGIRLSGTTTGINTTIRNNIIGDIKVTAASSTSDLVRGISLISTGTISNINLYYNTIYLNATSSGTNFSTTGIYHIASSNLTTAKLEMINNIIVNVSTSNGTGLTVTYRRSGINLGNYGNTSNNNLWYAGSPSPAKLLFYDGSNSDQILATYKARMLTRDANTVTEDLITNKIFLSTVTSSADYLHIDDSKATLVKSGGVAIAGVSLDFDNEIRYGNTGYAGTGTATDIGADEYAGITYIPLSGAINVGIGQAYQSLTSEGGLFSKINRVGLSGHVTVNITSDLAESGLEGLNEWAETGQGSYKLIIKPNSTVTRVISGNVLTGMIRLNGADRVIIDGGIGKNLTFRNTHTSGTTGTAITLKNGATDNIIRRCTLEAYTDINNGVLLFSTSATFEGGNSNNLVEFCDINGTVGTNSAIVCLLSAGTNISGFENTNNIISNNNIYNFRDRGLGIKSTGSFGWTIIGNSIYNGGISGGIIYASASTLHGIRILGGSGYTISNNYIGGSLPMATGSNANYSTATGNVSFHGILLNNTNAQSESYIKGNTIARINVTTFPAAVNSTAFAGIETNGSGIYIGGMGKEEKNLVGSNVDNSSIVITSTTTKTTNNTFVRGIYCNSSGGQVIGNQVGGIDITNLGIAPAPTVFQGIFVNNPDAPSKINNNLIGSSGAGAAPNSIQVLSASTATNTSLTGIYIGTSVGSALQLDSNIISHLSHLSNSITVTPGGINGISTAAKNTAELSITNNSFINNTISSTKTTAVLYGIVNTGASASLKIKNNFLAGNTINSITSIYNAIRNTGVVFNSIEINRNKIGDINSPAITFSVANSGSQVFILNSGGSSGCNLSISDNEFQNVQYSANNGTGANTYISNTAITLSQIINGNSFTNLNPQTSGSNIFITNSVVVPSAGFQNINNNFISGTFSKKPGGTITLLTSTATGATGSTINISNNDFSNITVTGATVIAGLVNTDAGNSNKTIQGNIFTNWSCGTSAVTIMNINLSGVNNAISGNIIRNISSVGTITGITTAAGNDNIYNNTIDTLFSTGTLATIVSGINVTNGTSKNIYQNTISNIQGNNMTTGSVRGILISGGTAVNLYQNTIYGLTANSLTSGTLSGIWVSGGAAQTISRNKIYNLSTTSTTMSGQIYGIQVSGSVANMVCTINNNIIGDLRATAISSVDAIRGIGVISTGATSTTNVYFNTIYLNASSTGTNFGSSGIYHTASSIATTSTLNLINNSVTNLSVSNGTGMVVAYRRSGTNLGNYGTASNNNMFYAGTPSSKYLIFFDGNSDQTLTNFKARMAPRENASITEDLVATSIFSSTAGSDISYLHIDQNKITTLRSAGIILPGFTDDFDGDIRFGNTGYAGNGTAPDIGADEFAGLQFLPFSGVYNVGAGQNYTSLTNSNGIFSKINSLGFSGNVTINIVSDLNETGAEALNQWTELGGENYTLLIQPDAASPRLISGNVVSGMIRFNGADRVRIDGGINRLLTFRNTNASGTTGTAFTFMNGASYDTIRYCNIEAYANATNGVILYGTSATGSVANSNNLLEFNSINGTVAGNISLVTIYSSGTTGKPNSSNKISNNIIYDFRDRAIDITATGSTGWTISSNSIYNGNVTSAVNYPASSELHGIRILGGSGYTIANNYIGGSAALGTGSNASYSSTLGNIGYQGILLTTTGSLLTSTIKGNIIAQINIISTPASSTVNSFIGIETNGNETNIGGSLPGEGNLIGSNTVNGSIFVSTSTTSATYTSIIKGINSLSTGGVIMGNQVGGIDISNTGTFPAASAFSGIYVNHANAVTQVINNIIGSDGAVTNSIRVLSTSTATTNNLTGIEIGTSVGSAIQINANRVQHISNLSTTSSGSFTGINNTASVAGAVMTITNNLIRNIYAGTNSQGNSTVYTGISSSSPSTISSDTITNIRVLATGSASQIKGIVVSGAFAHSINNNFISALSAASTKVADVETGSPSGFTIVGIINNASVPGQLIYSNTISNLASLTTDAINTTVLGIGVTTAGFSGSIYKNRLAGFTNLSAGSPAMPGITGIMGINGTANVYNNVIKFDNETNNNGVKIYGINHAASTAWNYFYNSISIGGEATGAATRTAPFVRTVNGAVMLKNNVFINIRTGTGVNYGISNKNSSPATNWTASDFNNFYSSTAATTAEWGNGGQNSFSQWQSNSGGDLHSVNSSVSFVPSDFDLQPDSNSNCAIENTATVISSPPGIDVDINGMPRSAKPDMGAYEFTYAVFIVTASNNSPFCAGSNINLFSNPGAAISPTYSWKDPLNVVVSTLQNPTTPGISGTYTLTVTDMNGCSAASLSTTVALHPAPVTSLSYLGSPFCRQAPNAPLTFSGEKGGTFSSTPGLMINATTGDVTLANSTDGTYKVTYTLNGICSVYFDSTFITIKTPFVWSGTANADWNNAANWPCGLIPTQSDNMVVPAGTPYFPVLKDGFRASVNNLTIQNGASLTVINNILQIAGTIINNGLFDVSTGTIEMTGTSAQILTAKTFKENALNHLIINNSSSSGVSLGGQVDIYGSLTYKGTGRIFHTNDTLTLKSTAANTAWVGDLTGNHITGKVTVERYNSPHKAWRFLSIPTNTTQTIKEAWQEGGLNNTDNPVPGYGTQLTGAGGLSAGFDLYTATPSIKTFNSITNQWDAVANTNSLKIQSTKQYFVFIRGNRSSNAFNSPVTETVLRTKGTLNTGTIGPMVVSPDKFAALGNPYASPIDFTKVTRTNGVDEIFYVWDPFIVGNYNLGGYQTMSATNNWEPVPGGSTSYPTGVPCTTIQSGQAFLVHASYVSAFVPANYEVYFNENNKVSGSGLTTFSRPQGTEGRNSRRQFFRASLYTGSSPASVIADGNVVAFDENFSSDIDGNDALKITAAGENFDIKRHNKLLAIEGRNSLKEKDTIYYNISRLAMKTYQLRFSPVNMGAEGMEAFLIDNYLNIQTPVSLTDNSFVNITITGDAKSGAADRFMVVFRKMSVLPVTFVSITAKKMAGHIAVNWKAENETNLRHYDIERSSDGRVFTKSGSIKSSNLSSASYEWLDEKIEKGNYYYRIRSVDKDGKLMLSQVVKVVVGGLKAELLLFPNPIVNSTIQIQFTNQPAGVYGIKLLNSSGQVILSKTINHQDGNGTKVINPDHKLAKGIYELEILKPGGIVETIKILN